MAIQNKLSDTNNKDKMYPLGAYESLANVQIFSKIFVGSCYYRNHLGTFKKSLLLFLNSVIFLIAQIIIVYRFITTGHINAFTDRFKFANYLEQVPYINNVILTIFNQIVTEKKIETFLALEKIDQTFLATDQKVKLLKANKKVRAQSKKVIIFLLVFYSAMSVTTQLVNPEEKYWYHAIKHFFVFLPSLANICEFASTCTLVETRFKIINDIFEEKIKESEHVDKYPINSTFFIRSVEVLMNQHEKLRNLTKNMNTAFNFLLLAIPIHVLSIFVPKGIKIILAVISEDISGLIQAWEWAVDIVYTVITLAIICHHVDNLILEADSTLQFIHGIQIRIDDSETIKTVILSTIHLDGNKIGLSAFELFSVDNSLLFYICAGALSYLVITYQCLLYKGRSRFDNSTVLPTEVTLFTNQT